MWSRLSFAALCGVLWLARYPALAGGLLHARGVAAPEPSPLTGQPEGSTKAPSQRLAAVEVDGRWGFADIAGNLRIGPRFDYAGSFSDGLAAVRDGDKWGFIDRAGHVRIRPEFGSVDKFAEGAAAVESQGKWGFIDAAGKVRVKPQFNYARSFSDGLALVKVVSRRGFMGKRWRLDIEPRFADASSFSQGLAPVLVGCVWGFVDRAGNLAIAPRFQEARQFSDGLAAVKERDEWAFIDRTGVVRFRLRWPMFWRPELPRSWLLALVAREQAPLDGCSSGIDPCMVYDVGQFSEGLVPVLAGGRWGFVDGAGRVGIKPQFAYAYGFTEGFAAVRLPDHSWAFINARGAVVLRSSAGRNPWCGARPFHGGMAGVLMAVTNGTFRWGFIDRAGRAAVGPRFQQVRDMQ